MGGRYSEDGAQAEVVTERPSDHRGVADYALDTANAERLWNVATDLVA
ncbi:hypothetical protein [Catellatospora sp. NPDC049609]